MAGGSGVVTEVVEQVWVGVQPVRITVLGAGHRTAQRLVGLFGNRARVGCVSGAEMVDEGPVV